MKNHFIYELVCSIFQWDWLIEIFATHLIIHFKFNSKYKKRLTLLSGYIVGLIGTYLYWWFAAKYAPTEEIQMKILTKDGAPQLFAPFVMPFFVIFYI